MEIDWDGDGEDLLLHLRHGLRKSRQLAEVLTADPLVGGRARAFLGRIEAIQAEIEAMRRDEPALRHADNDPLWRNNRRALH